MYEKDSHHRGSAIIRYGNGRNYPTKRLGATMSSTNSPVNSSLEGPRCQGARSICR